jgi:hypothetical protein
MMNTVTRTPLQLLHAPHLPARRVFTALVLTAAAFVPWLCHGTTASAAMSSTAGAASRHGGTWPTDWARSHRSHRLSVHRDRHVGVITRGRRTIPDTVKDQFTDSEG